MEPMTLAHDDLGPRRGHPVLLIHSTVCDRRMWDPLVEPLLAAGLRVLRCDQRGYGDSPVPTESWNDADDVVALLDHAGVERVSLVGASGGGEVAVELAATSPERISSLLLLCSALADHVPSDVLRAFGAREDELLDSGDLDGATALNVETWLGPEADADVRRLVALMQRHVFEVQTDPSVVRVRPRTREVRLADVSAPTLAISGEHDLPDFRTMAERVGAEVPGARHVHLDWAGHLPSLERPAEVAGLVVEHARP